MSVTIISGNPMPHQARQYTTEDKAGNAQPTASADELATVHLTETAQQLQQTFNDSAVLDQEKVDKLRNAIDNGVYEIDPQRIATKIMEFEESLQGNIHYEHAER